MESGNVELPEGTDTPSGIGHGSLVHRKMVALRGLIEDLQNGVPADELTDYSIDLKDLKRYFQERISELDVPKLGEEDVTTTDGFVIPKSASDVKMILTQSVKEIIERHKEAGSELSTRAGRHYASHKARPESVRTKLGHTTGG